ncbi:MAG TPA: hypothetical protein VGO31_10350 [Microbacteriaceae bacterium]|jgi:hypothetical protein|nr:hypothetical protein [Microbacteriaceae bacterium]
MTVVKTQNGIDTEVPQSYLRRWFIVTGAECFRELDCTCSRT